jgi:hypothetical protein
MAVCFLLFIFVLILFQKTKLSVALSLKKKNVTSLVEKWQQARRELSTSDEED